MAEARAAAAFAAIAASTTRLRGGVGASPSRVADRESVRDQLHAVRPGAAVLVADGEDAGGDGRGDRWPVAGGGQPRRRARRRARRRDRPRRSGWRRAAAARRAWAAGPRCSRTMMSVNVAPRISDVIVVAADPDVGRVRRRDRRAPGFHEARIIPDRWPATRLLRYRHRNALASQPRRCYRPRAHDSHPVERMRPTLRGGANVRTWRTGSASACVWLLAAGTGWAQAVAGSQVSGVVKDSSGGVLPGVEVTITKTDTGTARTVFTGADGAYVFPEPAGRPLPAEGRRSRASTPTCRRASSCRSTPTRRSTSR